MASGGASGAGRVGRSLNATVPSNEVAAEGIRVNSVSPGIIATEMITAVPDAQRAAAASPLGRMGRPNEVAATVAWLISPAASFITGSDITVSGGR
jgi:NAD(P)-dependent dehydrogenase (short-subunit alcohol dehydrogenase family)